MLRLLALITVLLTLAGCTAAPAPARPDAPAAPPAAAPPAPAAPDPALLGPLSAKVETLAYTATFVLEGYTGATPPTITIRSITGAVYADHAPASAEGRYILDTLDRAERVADQLTYTWNTPDGRTLSGEFLYLNPRNTQKWQIAQTEHLVLYHAAPLEAGEAELLEGTVQRTADLLGVPMPEHRYAIYLFPDQETLLDLWSQLGMKTDLPPKAFTYPGETFVRGGWPVAETARTISHEAAHALGAYGPPLFLAEGLPEYVSQVEMARMVRETGYASPRRQQLLDNFKKLYETMKQGGRRSKVDLEDVPLMVPEPWNAYFVGAAFMLFVHAKYGDDGIRRLFARFRNGSGDTKMLEEFFQEPFFGIQAEFNDYLRSGQALQDARTVFDMPG